MYEVIFQSGVIGLLIWVLLFATSTAGLALLLRGCWLLRRKRFGTTAAREELLRLLRAGDWERAHEFCGSHPALITRITAAVLEVAHCRTAAERQELATELLDREARSILRLINTLSLCGNIAPMLGLLGTVTGMVDAFMGLGVALGPEKASILAISISQALYTTAAGLLIAVPVITGAVLFRNTLERRTEQTVEEMERLLELIPEPESPSGCGNTQTTRIPGA